MKFRLAGFLSESITDGTGFRAVVFFQGCLRACPGCQNPQTHDPAGGSESTTEEMIGKILADPYLDGVTRDIPIPEHVAGDRHGGGDYNLLEAFVNAILTGDRSGVVSGMAESFDTHMLTFAAEQSRLTGTVVAPDGM